MHVLIKIASNSHFANYAQGQYRAVLLFAVNISVVLDTIARLSKNKKRIT